MSLPTRIFVKTAEMLASKLCQHRDCVAVRPVQHALTAFKYRFENVNFDFRTNGEERILQKLATGKPSTIFDVGANTGDYALLANQLCPDAIIHTFEPLPSTFDILSKRLANVPRVRLNNFGLGSSEQTVKLYHHGGGDVTASAFPLGPETQSANPVQSASVRMVRGDDYVNSAAVSKVDFLKIDVEGMEYEVIQGFGKFLAGNVECVQFEYGVFNIISHYLLRDICRLLGGEGFTIGKVYPRFVEFFDYDFTKEDFLGNNFVAIRRQRKDLIQLLAGR
jgi:FkbM family methyltransferase